MVPVASLAPVPTLTVERKKKVGEMTVREGRREGEEAVSLSVSLSGWHTGQNDKKNAEEKSPVDLRDKQSQISPNSLVR